jgi:hypothetical protein
MTNGKGVQAANEMLRIGGQTYGVEVECAA